MPSPTRPTAPPSSKRAMSDAESAPQDTKKPRTSSASESTRRDANRDTKRRRKRKKKAPVVSPKSDPAQSRSDERPRAPSSARITFSPVPPDSDLPAGGIPSPQIPSTSSSRDKVGGSPFHTPGHVAELPGRAKPFTPEPTAASLALPRCPSPEQSGEQHTPATAALEDRVARLEAELRSRDNLIASHQALLHQVHQAVTCQVCLDLMYKPYALAPCGHIACHDCLVNWFTAPPADDRPLPPTIARRKTCPHCRALVRERPVEIWGVKGIAQAVGKSALLPNQPPVPVQAPEALDVNADPWKDIFPKTGTATHRGFPWFFPGADLDDDDAHIAEIAPRGEDVGMLDMEDGGIYRCLDCMHEIWDGVCSSCGRVYPGHGPGDDDEAEGAMGWLEDQMGAEQVDVADDPSWMGLEDGEADDDGDLDGWRPFVPWRRQFHRFRGPWGFFDAVYVDEEDEEDGQGRPVRALDEDQGSEDDGYESSFIDDDDDDDADGPRIYEIVDDRDGPPGDERSDVAERRRGGRGRAVVSSDEEGAVSEDEMAPGRARRARWIVESDAST